MENKLPPNEALSFGRDFLSAGKKSPKEFESLLGYFLLQNKITWQSAVFPLNPNTSAFTLNVVEICG